MPRTLHLTWLALLCAFPAFCQEAESVSAIFKTNDKGYQVIVLRYFLVSPQDNISCLVRVKYTRGSSSFYLKHVTGDVGNLVLPGPGKEIVWDYQEELIHNVSTEPVVFDIEVLPTFAADRKVKKGRNLIVNLDDVIDKKQSYAIKLFRKKREVAVVLDTLTIRNHIVVPIPRKTRVGKGYQVAIVGPTQAYYTNTFRVKPIVATGWKVLPLFLVPVYILTKQQLDQQTDLPSAPQSPTN